MLTELVLILMYKIIMSNIRFNDLTKKSTGNKQKGKKLQANKVVLDISI
jgi:hypothetical protein